MKLDCISSRSLPVFLFSRLKNDISILLFPSKKCQFYALLLSSRDIFRTKMQQIRLLQIIHMEVVVTK